MKFLRQFAVVVLTVAVIVGLGLLWAHVSGGGPDPGSALRRPPPHAALVRLEQVKTGAVMVRADNGIHLANAGDLVKTGMIEAVLASAVIMVSAARRRHRTRRRAARSSSPGSSSPGSSSPGSFAATSFWRAPLVRPLRRKASR